MDNKEKAFFQISLKAIIKNEKGEVLILKHAKNDSFAGFYDLPGGRIDTDELSVDIVEILKREILEEIGHNSIEIKKTPVAVNKYSFERHNVLYLFYDADYTGGEVVISDEHAGHLWIKLEEIDPKKYFAAFLLEGVESYLKNWKATGQ